MIATPVMACCVTGHMDQGASSVSAEMSTLPPCHQGQALAMKAANSDHEDKTPEKFCSSCDDCAVSPADYSEITPALTATSDHDVVAIGHGPARLIATDVRLPDSTAPPRRQTLPVDSPLFITDSLLI